jgi:D-arabinan exo alpha-(1,3)/(1,5)-arabinofuranosidase (non-reducing end)
MSTDLRRNFVGRLMQWSGLAAAAAAGARGQSSTPRPAAATFPGGLGDLYLARGGRNQRSSSHDLSGRNNDYVAVQPGTTATIADIRGAGYIRHIWITIATEEPEYLRRCVLRAYWDGEEAPSIESPVGDFFGVGHARVSNYSSLPLNMVTGGQPMKENRAAMNCYFPMPFARGARLTVENQGTKVIRALYFNIDYEQHDSIPGDALRFHAHWRRVNPTAGTMDLSNRNNGFLATNAVVNLDGKNNYVILEAAGRGHYVGCNLSIDHINPIPNFGWFGEGDDMIFIDGEATPSIIGTGTEDYFCAAWGYPGGFNPMPYHGISLAGPNDGLIMFQGKWTMYRFHIQDPVMFTRSIKVTIEHGHGNVQSNDYSSVAYWYQTEPHQPFPALAKVEDRLPIPDAESNRKFWKTY